MSIAVNDVVVYLSRNGLNVNPYTLIKLVGTLTINVAEFDRGSGRYVDVVISVGDCMDSKRAEKVADKYKVVVT